MTMYRHVNEILLDHAPVLAVAYLKYTHPESSDRLRGSHITQYHCGYCKLQ